MLGVWRVEGEFEGGKHLEEWAYRLQKHRRTSTVSARYHIKTTLALGFLAWQMYRMERMFNEWLLIGYTGDLAGHHLKRGKRYLTEIPEYFKDYKSTTSAETIMRYQKDGCEFICEPEGIHSFKRGRHPRGIICDDILRDPEVKLDISQLVKIERVFVDQIMPMPKEDLHIFGTPQDQQDLFHRLEQMSSFNCKRYPAIINETKKQVLWPEVWSYDRLVQQRKDMRERSFNKEFQCRPVRSEEGYFTIEELDSVIKARLRNYGYARKCKTDKYCYGGYDLGKKRHPSHISIFAESRRGKLIQVASIWMDGWDYTRQLEICQMLSKHYTIQGFQYDDTRAELEGFNERGELPPEMEGVSFTQKRKFEIAATFEKEIKSGNIMLLPDERQKRQILNVDNDLKSMETAEGHGDAFWSNALAIDAARGAMPNIR